MLSLLWIRPTVLNYFLNKEIEHELAKSGTHSGHIEDMVSTALSFCLKAGDESNFVLLALALGITTLLVILQRAALWMLKIFKAD